MILIKNISLVMYEKLFNGDKLSHSLHPTQSMKMSKLYISFQFPQISHKSNT